MESAMITKKTGKKAAKKKAPKKTATDVKGKGPNDWTIIIYFASDNNLSVEMLYNLKEMMRVGAGDRFDVVVLYDAEGTLIRYDIPKAKVPPVVQARPGELMPTAPQSAEERLDFNLLRQRPEDDFGQRFKSRTMKNHSAAQDHSVKEDTLSKDNLAKFIKEAISDHEAKHYMLVLSGHGQGTIGDFLVGNIPSERLTIPLLGTLLKYVLPAKTKFDILGLDSCVMCMAEVATEVHEYANILIANEGFQLSAGWNFAAVLQFLRDRTMDPNDDAEREQVAQEIVRRYIRYYMDFARAAASLDQSALDLGAAKIDSFTKALRTLSVEMKTELSKKDNAEAKRAIVHAHWQAQSYAFEQYTDLWDFCNCLSQERGISRAVVEACEEVQRAIDQRPLGDEGLSPTGITLISGYIGAAYQYSYGLSVFFPWANILDATGTPDLTRYNALKFASPTGWADFLKVYLEKTQRDARYDQQNENQAILSGLNRRSIVSSFMKFGAPDSDLFGAPDSDLGITGDNITAKIGEMKNPPIKWHKRRL
jgi:hypothetical protein